MIGVGDVSLVLFLFLFHSGNVDGRTTTTTTTKSPFVRDYALRTGECNTEQIEYRLTKLEVQVGEKSEHLSSELREGNRRLQALEYDVEGARTGVEELKSEIGRFVGMREPARLTEQPYETEKMESRINNLAQGMQLVVATMRKVNSEIDIMKKNLSAIKNATSALLLRHDNLATKHYLSTVVSEMRNEYSHSNMLISSWNSNSNTTKKVPRSCKDVLEKDASSVSGIYRIQPENSPESFLVLCDMVTNGGGWTFIHNRFDGSQDFYQDSHSYKVGFGNLAGEFWLGLEHIYQLTGFDINELLVELIDQNEVKSYAQYAAFSIGPYSQGYPLKVLGGYTGDAGDSLSYHAGSKFSTKDLDLDSWTEGSCALSHNGAWWYKQCDRSNLNGLYIRGMSSAEQMYQGMYWNDFGGPQYSLKEARMLVRERSSNNPPVVSNRVNG